jgi:hypothetical protein
MECKKICFPQEYSEKVLEELGQIENGLEIIDNNQNILSTKREFFESINRCNKIEKKISKIEKIYQDFSFKIKNYDNITEFYKDYEEYKNSFKLNTNSFFDFVENQINEDEFKLGDLISYKNELIDKIINKHEKFHTIKLLFNTIDDIMGKKANVRKTATNIYKSEYSIYEENELSQRLLEGGMYQDNGFYMCGVIRSEDKLKFQRVIFRSVFSRCNFNFIDIPEINKKFINDIEISNVK